MVYKSERKQLNKFISLKSTEFPVNDNDEKENGEWSINQVTFASYLWLQRGKCLNIGHLCVSVRKKRKKKKFYLGGVGST